MSQFNEIHNSACGLGFFVCLFCFLVKIVWVVKGLKSVKQWLDQHGEPTSQYNFHCSSPVDAPKPSSNSSS